MVDERVIVKCGESGKFEQNSNSSTLAFQTFDFIERKKKKKWLIFTYNSIFRALWSIIIRIWDRIPLWNVEIPHVEFSFNHPLELSMSIGLIPFRIYIIPGFEPG